MPFKFICEIVKMEPNLARLAELKNLMAIIPEDKFDLSLWIKNFDTTGRNFNSLIHECGTSACSVGWACTHEPFNLQGLHYQYDKQTGAGFPYYVTVEGDVYTGMDAVEEFFGLPSWAARTLFVEDEYGFDFYDEASLSYNITPRDVASRIEVLINHHAEIFDEETGGWGRFIKLLAVYGA